MLYHRPTHHELITNPVPQKSTILRAHKCLTALHPVRHWAGDGALDVAPEGPPVLVRIDPARGKRAEYSVGEVVPLVQEADRDGTEGF